MVIELNEKTGLIQAIHTDGKQLELEQEFLWYAAREPIEKKYTSFLWRKPSGAYIFRPNQTDPFPCRLKEGVSISIYKGCVHNFNYEFPNLILRVFVGKLVQEIHQRYNSWVGQIIRLYMGQDHVELDWIVGPISVE